MVFSLAAGLLLPLLIAAPAGAQAPVALAALDISLWPEYDQPSMLVILDGTLASEVALPASLSIPIPAAAGQPHAVAVRAANGDLLQAEYTTSEVGEVIIVQFVTNSAGFRVEYYDPALAKAGEAREYAFNWKSDYPVANAAVRVLQPVGARALTAEPALEALPPGADSLTYYAGSLGALEAGQPVALQVRYMKADDTLTAVALGAQPVAGSQPAAGSPSATVSETPGTQWVIVGGGALGLALVGAGAYWYWRGQQAARPAPAAARRSRRRSRKAHQPQPARQRTAQGTAGARSGAAFCTQCGARTLPGDRFCRSCGAKAA